MQDGRDRCAHTVRFFWIFCTQSTSNSRARTFFKGKNVLFDNIQIPKRQLIELP